MASLINTSNFADFVANSQINFRRAFDDFPKVASQLYDVEYTDLVTGEESSLEGFTMAKIKDEGDDFAYLDINQGDNKIWNVYEIGGMTKITWKMRVANKYRVMNQRISNLGKSAARRMEIDLTHRFTFGTATSYTSQEGRTITTTLGNGKQLFYSGHDVPGSTSTYRNRVANNPQLSKGGIEAGEKLFTSQMIDSNGELINEMPDSLIIANNPTMKNTALEYLRSTSAPEGAVSGIYNVYNDRYKLIVLPFLATNKDGAYDSTKESYWMLANLRGTDAVCKILSAPRLIPPTENDGKEFETMDWLFASHAAYAIEIVRGQWIVMSDGLGTA
jgi:hypothetical protein